MRMRTSIVSFGLWCAAAGLLGIGAADARAASLTVNGWTSGEQVYVQSEARTGWVNTAELDVTFGGQDGFSYCVDLGQSIGAGASSGWATRAADLDAGILRAAWLVEFVRPGFDALLVASDGGAGFDVTRATAIAALQIAIWEVVADAPGAYDLLDGEFSIGEGGASAGVLHLARGFLGDLEARGIDGFDPSAVWAFHASRQDQIVVNPIPEPSSLILFAAGAGLVAFSASRKPR